MGIIHSIIAVAVTLLPRGPRQSATMSRPRTRKALPLPQQVKFVWGRSILSRSYGPHPLPTLPSMST